VDAGGVRPEDQRLAGESRVAGVAAGANKEMLCDFLDALEIKHADDGTVDELPREVPKEKIAMAVDRLLGKYRAENVGAYLHASATWTNTVQWPALDEVLAEEARLKLG